MLYRGFGGQTDDSYNAMTGSGTLTWPAFSSCALDRNVSVSYIDGTAANSAAKDGSAVLFVIDKVPRGQPLWHISQYPDEKELLLPPLTKFVVTRTTESDELKSKCIVGLKKIGKKPAKPLKAAVVNLEADSAVMETLLRLIEYAKADAKKAEQRLRNMLGESDEAAPTVDEELKRKKQELETALRELENRRNKLKEKTNAREAPTVEQRAQEAVKVQLEGKLETLWKCLDEEEHELIETPERVQKYGRTFTSAMMYLKGLAINLGSDWRFIGEIYKAYSTSPLEGMNVAFIHLRSLVEAEYGEQSTDTRWRLPIQSRAHLYRPDQEEVISAVKQLVICHDMLPSHFNENLVPWREIVLNIDHLCEIYNNSHLALRKVY
eukprot:TRINITY_DN6733_c0_g1_i1.p1 TRINITY_DN6733_c0_g1~~TRINITY_DN6733_c0_g1_i1.p1  ORF type:complete len:379 (+),score=67.27 TRINITY_DN6733_c0_g1_i1:855-1991(+)